jgi:hypothetical protein
MSLTLGYFSKFPAAYKDREKSIGEVRFNNIHQDIIKDKIIIHASTDKYQQEMEIQDEIIHLNSPVKVFCTCESLKYEFPNAVFRAGSLLKSVNFVRSIISRPKEKNQYNVPSGCKHIVALARQVIKIKPKRG